MRLFILALSSFDATVGHWPQPPSASAVMPCAISTRWIRVTCEAGQVPERVWGSSEAGAEGWSKAAPMGNLPLPLRLLCARWFHSASTSSTSVLCLASVQNWFTFSACLLGSTSVVLLGCATLKQEGQAARSRALQQMLCVALNVRHPSPMCEWVPVPNRRTAALPKQLFISHYISVWGLVYFTPVYQRIFGVLDVSWTSDGFFTKHPCETAAIVTIHVAMGQHFGKSKFSSAGVAVI